MGDKEGKKKVKKPEKKKVKLAPPTKWGPWGLC